VTICHDPPGTSKWKKLAHRMLSFISVNWLGEHRRISGRLSGAVSARHPASAYPLGARVQPGRQSSGLADRAPPPHRLRRPIHRSGPARLRVVLCLWCGGAHDRRALLFGTAVRACRPVPTLPRGLGPGVAGSLGDPAPGAPRRTHRSAPAEAGTCPPSWAPARRSGAAPDRARLARPLG
jgi:DDE family transposase